MSISALIARPFTLGHISADDDPKLDERPANIFTGATSHLLPLCEPDGDPRAIDDVPAGGLPAGGAWLMGGAEGWRATAVSDGVLLV